MFTVVVGFDGSGKSSTRSPLGSEYSVIPSTDATFVSAGRADAAAREARAAGVPWAAAAGVADRPASRNAAENAAAAHGDRARLACGIEPRQVKLNAGQC